MSATRDLLSLDANKSIRKDPTGTNSRFSHADCLDIQDPTGISNEEGELLYGFLRCIKPLIVVETGTNIGVSTAYMAHALRDNGWGRIFTVEHLGIVAERAKKKLRDVRLEDYVTVATGEFDSVNLPDGLIDFAWLDTEFKTRYAELVRLLPRMRDGAFIGIHDLTEVDNPAYGVMPDTMHRALETGELRAVNFNTTSGIVMFQKSRGWDSLRLISGGV